MRLDMDGKEAKGDAERDPRIRGGRLAILISSAVTIILSDTEYKQTGKVHRGHGPSRWAAIDGLVRGQLSGLAFPLLLAFPFSLFLMGQAR